MNILQAIDDPAVFAQAFADPATWLAWRAFLAALLGLDMSEEEQAIFTDCTQRNDQPTEQAKEAWLICGRRSGKSFTLALVAVFLACFKDWRPHLRRLPRNSSRNFSPSMSHPFSAPFERVMFAEGLFTHCLIPNPHAAAGNGLGGQLGKT